MDQAIKAGIFGVIIAVVINSLSPEYLYFLPQFIASIIAIYIYGIKTFKDGLLATFTTYLFTEWVVGAVIVAGLFAANEPYTLTVDMFVLLDQIFTTLTALIAAPIGVWLAKKRPERATPPPPPPALPPL
jgi:ABC-type branched-subunit amino acid transport system permease subunit